MAEDRTRQVRVTYRRFVSDSNYGTEGAEVSLEWYADNTDSSHDDAEAAEELLRQAHDLVHNQLRRSQTPIIRKTFNSRTTASPSTAATVPSEDEEALPF